MRNKTKIVILVSGLPPTTIGGAEIAAQNIATILLRKQFEVHIITRNVRIEIGGKKRSLKKIEDNNGCIIHRIPCSNVPILRFITHVIFGLRVLIQLKPDIIHAQQITPNGLIAVLGSKFLRKKSLIYARGAEIYNSSLFYLKSFAQFVISHANLTLGVSKFLTERMKQMWPQKPIFMLSNGIELDNYFHDQTSKSNIDLIFVGRLVKNKRAIDAIKAVSNLKEQFPKIILTIIGSGPRMKYLKDQIGLLNVEENVRVLGWISPEKIPEFLSKSDIFIFPSLYESFGIAILEAMASSLPVIASRSTAIPELVQDQINGLLHSPGNVDELTKNLKILIQNADLRRSMGQKSHKIAEKYRWEKIIDKLIKLYFNM